MFCFCFLSLYHLKFDHTILSVSFLRCSLPLSFLLLFLITITMILIMTISRMTLNLPKPPPSLYGCFALHSSPSSPTYLSITFFTFSTIFCDFHCTNKQKPYTPHTLFPSLHFLFYTLYLYDIHTYMNTFCHLLHLHHHLTH